MILDVTDRYRQAFANHPNPDFRDPTGPRDPGFIPVHQLNYLFGRNVPCGVTPFQAMRTPDDKMLDAPPFHWLLTVGYKPGVTDNVGRTSKTAIEDILGRHLGWRVEAPKINITRVSAHVVNGEPIADITVKSSQLHGITVEGDLVVRMIDEFPILAVLATQAQGETIVREAEELHVKESDRIGSLASELRKLGAQIEEQPDGFIIVGPTRLHGATVDSHGDHRLAMSLAVAGMIAEGETTVTRADAYRESFPNFIELMRQLKANID